MSDNSANLSGERQIRRRFSQLLILLIWLLIMAFPITAFLLATQGQIQIGSDPNQHLRLFMIQEREAFGVGMEWLRPSRQRDNCIQGSINYWLWEGEGENVTFCQCYDPTTKTPLPSNQAACNAP